MIRKKQNTLNYQQQKKLEDWLRDNMARIMEKRWPRTRAAEEATEELGFEISANNVTGLCKVADIEWPHGYTAPKTPGRGPYVHLAERVTLLEETVITLMKRLDAPTPKQLLGQPVTKDKRRK